MRDAAHVQRGVAVTLNLSSRVVVAYAARLANCVAEPPRRCAATHARRRRFAGSGGLSNNLTTGVLRERYLRL